MNVLRQAPQSAWTPILAPLAAGALTSVNQPQIDKAGAADDTLGKPLTIPPHDHPVGPMTRARQRRIAAVFAGAQLASIGAVAADVELSQLRPSAEYRVAGGTADSVVADAQGRATVQVELNGRRELRLAPQA